MTFTDVQIYYICVILQGVLNLLIVDVKTNRILTRISIELRTIKKSSGWKRKVAKVVILGSACRPCN